MTFAVLTSFSGGCVSNRSLKKDPEPLIRQVFFFLPVTDHLCNKDEFLFLLSSFPTRISVKVYKQVQQQE